MLGLEAQQNLFVMSDDTWDRRAYLPAYVRRYPFCMTRVTVDGKERDERLACVERSAIATRATAVRRQPAAALPEWEQRRSC